MIPIHQLLSRIRWDPGFGDASFEIVYEDRMVGLIRIPFERIESIDSFSFTVFDELGDILSIPLHRIRKVYRNGELIWSREKRK